MKRWLVLAAGVALTVSLIAAPAAPASKSQTTIFDLGGFAFNVTPEKREELLNQAQALGVDTVRIIVFWRDIAPDGYSTTKPSFDATDPAQYDAVNGNFAWAALDQLVNGASARGMNVLLAPSAPVPHWASAAGDDFTGPDPAEFQKFVTAMGIRYSGGYQPPPINQYYPPPPVPHRVSMWSVWNEPNLELYLLPQYEGGQSVSGSIYRNLFLAAQQGLQVSGHGGDQLLIGETSPGPGRGGTHPLTFLRSVFCLNRKYKPIGSCQPISASGWAQHPYDPYDPPYKTSRNLINIHSIGKLAKALKKAANAGATAGRLPLYVTEFGIESVPDTVFGVSQLRQAEYIAISEYLLYRKPGIRSYAQYLMQDDGGGVFSFQTGLRFREGGAKVSYATFPIALVAQRTSKRDKKVTIWGHVRPGVGPYTVKVRFKDRGKGPKRLKKVQTNGGGYFRFATPFHRGRKYQASSAVPASGAVAAQSLQGPFQRVYIFK